MRWTTKPADLAHLLAVSIVFHFLPFPTPPICIPYSLYLAFPIFTGASPWSSWRTFCQLHLLSEPQRKKDHSFLTKSTTTTLFWLPWLFLFVLSPFPWHTNRLKFLPSYTTTTTTPQIFCTAMSVPQTKFPSPASFLIKHIHGNLHPQLTRACLVQSCPHHCPFKGQWWIFLSLPLHPYLYPSGVDPSKLFHLLIETHLFTRIHIYGLLLKGNSTQNQANIGIKLSWLLPTQLPIMEFLPGKDTQIYLI